MKTILITLVLSLFASLPAFSQTLVVSDIDDTLKISNVQDLKDSAQNTVLIHNHFLGMSELYNSLAPHGGIRFVYVSNAIEKMMGVLHDSFLNFNLFPEGYSYLRASVFETNHKRNIIGRLIGQHKPARVILIGDNGERDPQIYAQVRADFPRLPMDTFIHQVYSLRSSAKRGARLEAGQIGYATSVDLAIHLKNLQLLSEDDYRQFVEEIVPIVLNERNDLMSGEAAFPAWMDCRDVMFPAFDPTFELLTRYEKKARARCSLPNIR